MKAVTVEVYYVEGVDVVPAAFDVRLQFTGENIEVVQTGGWPLPL